MLLVDVHAHFDFPDFEKVEREAFNNCMATSRASYTQALHYCTTVAQNEADKLSYEHLEVKQSDD